MKSTVETKIIELVKSGHELAKELHCAESAALVSDLATQLDVQFARSNALAAENAKLADCANFYRLGFKPVKGAFGIEYRPTEQLLDDCGNTALESIKTPATDSFLAEVRASAIEHAAAERWGSGYVFNELNELAAQIRKGVQS